MGVKDRSSLQIPTKFLESAKTSGIPLPLPSHCTQPCHHVYAEEINNIQFQKEQYLKILKHDCENECTL